MTVHVLAFGMAKEIFGASLVDVELSNTTSVRNLRILLEERYPDLKKLGSYMIAVNNDYAQDQIIIHEKDEIAVIPPVSGG